MVNFVDCKKLLYGLDSSRYDIQTGNGLRYCGSIEDSIKGCGKINILGYVRLSILFIVFVRTN